MLFNATAIGNNPFYPMHQTVSENHGTQRSQFKLLCWDLPNAQLKTQNAFCGSSIRFDPCCASTTQFETSCCNRFCYNMSTTCEHPDQDKGAANQYHYGASTGNLYHEDDDEALWEHNHPDQQQTEHLRGKQDQNETTSIGWEGSVMIVLMLVVMVCCFLTCVRFL